MSCTETWREVSTRRDMDAHLAFHEMSLPGQPRRAVVWSDSGGFSSDLFSQPLREPLDAYVMRTRCDGAL